MYLSYYERHALISQVEQHYVVQLDKTELELQ